MPWSNAPTNQKEKNINIVIVQVIITYFNLISFGSQTQACFSATRSDILAQLIINYSSNAASRDFMLLSQNSSSVH
jgi:hypothetical protein